MKWNLTVLILSLVIILAGSSMARSVHNRRRIARREVTREANPNYSANEIAGKNPQVDEFIAELANLSIPHYLKDLYRNFTYSDGQIGGGRRANTIRSYGNTAKSEFCVLVNSTALANHHPVLSSVTATAVGDVDKRGL